MPSVLPVPTYTDMGMTELVIEKLITAVNSTVFFDETVVDETLPDVEVVDVVKVRSSIRRSLPYFMIITVSCFSFFGNFAVILAIFSKTFRRPVNYMLANLVATSALTVLSVCFVLIWRCGFFHVDTTSSWMCHLIPVLMRFPVPAEGFSVICISMDRSRVARNPWDRETSEGAFRKIFSVWAFALILELPQSIFWDFDPDATEPVLACRNDRLLIGSYHPWMIYVTFYLFCVYIVPSLVLLKELCHLISAYLFLTSSSTNISLILDQCTYAPETGENYRKMVIRNAIIFTLIFILVKLPVGVWYSLYELPEEMIAVSTRKAILYWKNVFVFIAYFHCAFYPLVVFVLSSEFRRYYRSFLRFC